MIGETEVVLTDESMREIVEAHFKGVLFREGKIGKVEKITALGMPGKAVYHVVVSAPEQKSTAPVKVTAFANGEKTYDYHPKSDEGHFNQQ